MPFMNLNDADALAYNGLADKLYLGSSLVWEPPAAPAGVSLTPFGSYVAEPDNTSNPYIETVSIGAAVPGQHLLVQVVWGDASGGNDTLLAPTMDGLAMTKQLEITMQREGQTYATYDVSAGGDFDLVLTTSDASSWRGYSLRKFLLTGHTSFAGYSDWLGGTVAHSYSVGVLDGDVLLGGIHHGGRNTTGAVTAGEITEEEYYLGYPDRIHGYYRRDVTADATLDVTYTVSGDAFVGAEMSGTVLRIR